MFFNVTAQKAERNVKDSTSFLENDFASSLARINPDGSLFHTLNTKPQEKPIPTQTPINYKDSIVYKDKAVKVTYPVARELTKWEKTCKNGFPIILSLLLLSIVWIFIHPLLNFLRRFL